MRKPAFNTGTFRLPNEATREGFVRFNPGPGSYSTRIKSIGSQFIDAKGADHIFKGLLSTQGTKDKKVFYTRENGGLKQHNQPLSMGITIREGVVMNPEAVKNTGPGHYEPQLTQDMQKVIPVRNIKSQGNARGHVESAAPKSFLPGTNWFQKQKV